MIDEKDHLARTILKIWNNSFLKSVQSFEFSDESRRDRIASNLSVFKDLAVNLDWYDSGFFRFNPVYTLEVRRV